MTDLNRHKDKKGHPVNCEIVKQLKITQKLLIDANGDTHPCLKKIIRSLEEYPLPIVSQTILHSIDGWNPSVSEIVEPFVVFIENLLFSLMQTFSYCDPSQEAYFRRNILEICDAFCETLLKDRQIYPSDIAESIFKDAQKISSSVDWAASSCPWTPPSPTPMTVYERDLKKIENAELKLFIESILKGNSNYSFGRYEKEIYEDVPAVIDSSQQLLLDDKEKEDFFDEKSQVSSDSDFEEDEEAEASENVLNGKNLSFLLALRSLNTKLESKLISCEDEEDFSFSKILHNDESNENEVNHLTPPLENDTDIASEESKSLLYQNENFQPNVSTSYHLYEEPHIKICENDDDDNDEKENDDEDDDSICCVSSIPTPLEFIPTLNPVFQKAKQKQSTENLNIPTSKYLPPPKISAASFSSMSLPSVEDLSSIKLRAYSSPWSVIGVLYFYNSIKSELNEKETSNEQLKEKRCPSFNWLSTEQINEFAKTFLHPEYINQTNNSTTELSFKSCTALLSKNLLLRTSDSLQKRVNGRKTTQIVHYYTITTAGMDLGFRTFEREVDAARRASTVRQNFFLYYSASRQLDPVPREAEKIHEKGEGIWDEFIASSSDLAAVTNKKLAHLPTNIAKSTKKSLTPPKSSDLALTAGEKKRKRKMEDISNENKDEDELENEEEGITLMKRSIMTHENNLDSVFENNWYRKEGMFPERKSDSKVVLVIDVREATGSNQDFEKCLINAGFRQDDYLIEPLPVGDFGFKLVTGLGEIFMLPVLIERKTCSDLTSSIQDGRYYEQRIRMARHAGCFIYLLEGIDFPMQPLNTENTANSKTEKKNGGWWGTKNYAWSKSRGSNDDRKANKDSDDESDEFGQKGIETAGLASTLSSLIARVGGEVVRVSSVEGTCHLLLGLWRVLSEIGSWNKLRALETLRGAEKLPLWTDFASSSIKFTHNDEIGQLARHLVTLPGLGDEAAWLLAIVFKSHRRLKKALSELTLDDLQSIDKSIRLGREHKGSRTVITNTVYSTLRRFYCE